MKICFLLLAHEHPEITRDVIETLTSAGHCVAVHYDKKAPNADFEHVRAAFQRSPRVRFASRVRVEWGRWSLIEATIAGIDAIEQSGWEPDYVYLISGADYPIKPAAELVDFLVRHRGLEFIDGVPADTVRWVKGGPQKERYLYRHYFSWRRYNRLAQYAVRMQRAWRMERRFVDGMTPFIGSQWWTLTWPTLRGLRPAMGRADLRAFFRWTWIPDEIFFQTLVRHLVPPERIVCRSLTLHEFTPELKPAVFQIPSFEHLLRQPFFFARKLCPDAVDLRSKLAEVWHADRSETLAAEARPALVLESAEAALPAAYCVAHGNDSQNDRV